VSDRRPLLWLVDDSATERAIILAALGDRYRYAQFGDGSEVVELLGSGANPPDAILLDWVMPGMSGDEVCRYVRSLAHAADLPIIVVTSSRVETLDIVQGLHLGANDYVPKPFATEELRARVASVLRTKELHEAAKRERTRLYAINRFGRALFEAGANVPRILEELVASLTGLIADGCAITLLPGSLPELSAARHSGDPDASELRAIATLADPGIFAFASPADALAKLPPKYHAYVRRFGLHGLAIVPFPILTPILGVVTLTRDGSSLPFDRDDISTIETCIEYASLAVQNATRFDTERAARTQLAAVLQHTPVGIVVADPRGAIKLVNPAATRIVPGIDRIDHVANVFTLGSWSTLDGRPLGRDDWASGFSAPARVELALRSENGTRRVLSITSVTLGDADEVDGSVSAIEDVTAQHAVATERERVAVFQEQMLGIVGHDLRSPLGAVITGAELLAMKPNDARLVEATARRMLSSGNRMTGIVEQLLDVTRARLGAGIPVSLTETSLAPIIHRVVEELAARARFRVVAADVRGYWDGNRLAQLISNLASNAVQYGHPTAPITIEASQIGDMATLAVANQVRDTPIPPEKIGSLFDPYHRGVDSALHRTGLGLGLYIAHEIVRAHGGRIAAKSSADGTVFTVQLPLRPPAGTGTSAGDS
jgi:phosphoserine phosphatase RsbU/P